MHALQRIQGHLTVIGRMKDLRTITGQEFAAALARVAPADANFLQRYMKEVAGRSQFRTAHELIADSRSQIDAILAVNPYLKKK